MDNKSGIYKITNKINGKCYIGKSINIFRRWRDEKNFRGINIYLKASFEKYGIENFTFEILEECIEEELNEKEKYYISLFDSTNKEKGYNMTFGGTGGRLTKEAIEKAKETKKRNGYTKYWLGKQISEQTKEKISNSLKGEKNPFFNKTGGNAPNSRKVECIELHKIFNSLKEAAEFINNKSNSNIRIAILRNIKAGGYHWRYIEEKPKIKNLTTGETFDSVREAAEKYNLITCLSTIHKVCKGERKTCGGYEWSYVF